MQAHQLGVLMKNFDTLQYTKRAIAAGIPQQAAEFHAEEMAAVINDSLVTKDHLEREVVRIEQHITQQITALENRLTWKFLGGIATVVTLSQLAGHFFK